MTKGEARTLVENLKDPRWYIENCLWIRNKKGELQKLTLKPAQEALYRKVQEERKAGRPVRIVILKARQLGFSTMIEALFFQETATKSNVRTLILAHEAEATGNLFRMNRLFYDNLPEVLQPMQRASNAQELLFANPSRDAQSRRRNPGLQSSIRCVTAGGKGVGRSYTMTNIHGSEVAFWPRMNETLTGALQAVPGQSGTCVILESTPNGFNEFKDFWDGAVAGRIGFIPLFFPWFSDPEYRKPVPPGTIWTEEERRMQETYGLDEEQLAWRRWCIADNLAGDAEKFRQEYPSCPEEAFLMSGSPYFDNSAILLAIPAAPEGEKGRFTYGEDPAGRPERQEWVTDPAGCVSIYTPAEEGIPYVIGADTAGDGSDRFTAHVLDNTTGRQVAQILYDGSSEEWFTQQLYCLGKTYNDALIAVEINFSTYPEKLLERWSYPKLYIREKTDDRTGELATRKWGWLTSSATRQPMLEAFHTVAAKELSLLVSGDLLREMLTFVRNRDMRPEAAEGKHDDLVMAAAIAHRVRYQQSAVRQEKKPEPTVKLIEKLEKTNRR